MHFLSRPLHKVVATVKFNIEKPSREQQAQKRTIIRPSFRDLLRFTADTNRSIAWNL
jgi:hypothetical protein